MLPTPVELALDYTQQLIAMKLGHEPTGPPITLSVIRQRIGIPTEVSDRELARQVLAVAFERIRLG